jgi:hypothetical protein
VQAPQAIETPKTPGPTVGGFVDHHDREPLFVAIAYTAEDVFVFGQGRQAAQEEDFDLATAQKIADWLGVTPTSIIDAEGVGKDALAAQIAAVLEMEPKLAEVFGEAMQRVLDGRMDLRIFKELAAYAAYRINTAEGDANAVRPETKTHDQGPM